MHVYSRYIVLMYANVVALETYKIDIYEVYIFIYVTHYFEVYHVTRNT